MKTSKFVLAVLFFFVGSVVTDLFAQGNLEAVIKKCAADKSVDKNIVQRKDPKTKEMEKVIRTYTIHDNQALKAEIKSAFDRDKEEAFQVIENESDGNKSFFIRFEKTKGTIAYSLSENEGMVSLTVIENFGDNEEPVKVNGVVSTHSRTSTKKD